MSDEQYNEIIKRQLLEQEDSYFADIKYNKNTTWNKIDDHLTRKKMIPFWIYALAAVIIIFICFGIIFNHQLNIRNIEIADLKTQLELKKTRLEIPYIEPFYKHKHYDSINYMNAKIVYLPVKLIDTIVLHDTVNIIRTDTVFIKGIENEQIAKQEQIKDVKFNRNVDIVVNQIFKEKKRERRFIFQFGKSKNETPVNETQYETKGLITLKSK